MNFVLVVKQSMKRIFYYMLLIAFISSNGLSARGEVLQDRKGGGRGRSEQTQKGRGSSKPVKEVPKSRKQDKPEPVRGKGRR
ncbi:hypothetical protein [Arcticibacter sp.]